MRNLFMVLWAFPGCAEDTPASSDHTMGELEAFLEATQMLIDGHVSAVEAASTLDEASGAEADYLATWALVGSEIEVVLTELEDCTLSGAASDHMVATRAALADLDTEMGAHQAQHEACATLADCVATEAGHGGIMSAGVDTCLELHEAMHDLVTCAPADSMGTMGM